MSNVDRASALQDDVVNILVVDDEPRNLTVLEAVLTDPRYRLVKAGSAEEALLALLRNEFALLILDVQMPGTTGFELAQTIKQRRKTSAIPIIFLTAYYNDDVHVVEGYDSGAIDYMLKPINPVVLRSKVGVLVDLHLKHRQLESAVRALNAEVSERSLVQAKLKELNDTLEQKVAERTYAYMQSERLNRLLMNEVNHRSKNLLGVVLAIAQQTRHSSFETFLQDFTNRVQALAVNQDLLVKNQWQSIDLAELVRGQMAHLAEPTQKRISVNGPSLRLSPSAAQSIGMALHELSTNALKHGSLSTSLGTVEVGWETMSNGAGDGFCITWDESGGSPVAPPTKRGFGTTVVTKMIEMGLGGKATVEYAVSGLNWRYEGLLARVVDDGQSEQASGSEPPAPPSL
jgi:two-component sensor histidine kinase